MKATHTIYLLASLWFIFLFSTPIIMDWNRVQSPNLPFTKNIEFNPSWDDPNAHRDMYVIVITYRHGVRPNDTIQSLYRHVPTGKDIICAGWFNETYSFYAPDDQTAHEYMFVESVKTIKWFTVINDPKEWERIQRNGYRIADSTYRLRGS